LTTFFSGALLYRFSQTLPTDTCACLVGKIVFAADTPLFKLVLPTKPRFAQNRHSSLARTIWLTDRHLLRRFADPVFTKRTVAQNLL